MAKEFLKKYAKIIGAAIILIGIFVVASQLSKKAPVSAPRTAKEPLTVSVQSAGDSVSLKQSIQYPAIVAGDQDITITAKSAGNAAAVNFDLGSKVSVGSLLVKIDDTGNTLGVGEKGFRSSEVQQSQLSKEQAEEELDLAKKNYKDLKNVYDEQKKNPALTKTVTKAQVDSAKEQIDIAEIHLDSTKVGFKGTLDDHLVTSPIAGVVTKKSVAVGDSISAGQELFTISKTALTKVQFFVAKEDLAYFQAGTEININEDGADMKGVVTRIAPQADQTTKRFLIEAKPVVGTPLPIGSVITVSFEVTRTPSEAGDIILPLSAITVGQNESYIFVAENGKAKKTVVTIQQVQGEFAQIKTDIPASTEIIIDGSKLVQDGADIRIK